MLFSMFERLQKVADNVSGVINSGNFRFRPMKTPKGGRGIADVTRSIIIIRATFDNMGFEQMLGSVSAAEVSTSAPVLAVREEYLPQGVTVGDLFEQLNADGTTYQTYQVTNRKPDGKGMLFLTVIET